MKKKDKEREKNGLLSTAFISSDSHPENVDRTIEIYEFIKPKDNKEAKNRTDSASHMPEVLLTDFGNNELEKESM